MKFLVGFVIGFAAAMFAVGWRTAQPEPADEWRGRVYTLRPNGWDYYTEVSS